MKSKVSPYYGKTGLHRLRHMEPCLRDKDAGDAIVAWCIGMSEKEINKFLRNHPSCYRSHEDFGRKD